MAAAKGIKSIKPIRPIKTKPIKQMELERVTVLISNKLLDYSLLSLQNNIN
jgi:hypothetical protein